MIFFKNQHVVAAGCVYRTAQLNEQQLRQYIAKKQIRTLINLRGRPISDWYIPECACSQDLGISQEDITTSANRLPSPTEIRRLIDVFDQAEYPILIHCQQGADRTGLASTAWQLLYTDATYESARRQCSPRYGHFRLMTTANMDIFFDMYEAWLSERQATHQPAMFREWATKHYQPKHAVARLVMHESPESAPVNIPQVLKLRATNLSNEPWEFHAGTLVGVHARYWLYDSAGNPLFFGQSGFLNRTVLPGESIDLPLPLPAVARPGSYRVMVDLSRQNIDFFQFGSEPLNHEWIAIDPAKPIK